MHLEKTFTGFSVQMTEGVHAQSGTPRYDSSFYFLLNASNCVKITSRVAEHLTSNDQVYNDLNQ